MPSAEEIREAREELRKLQEEESQGNRKRIVAAGAILIAYRQLTSSLKSLRQAGLENTVEANRQRIAYTLLGREIAGVFMPATTASTNALIGSARAMTSLNEKGQNFAFVLSAAVTGLVTFKAAQLAAAAAGLKFSGAAGGVVNNLGKIGLMGGIIGGLAALFLASDAGARTLEGTMESLVKLANELGDALDDAMHNPGKFWDDFNLGLRVIGENAGADLFGFDRGRARKFYDETTVPNKAARGGLDEKRTRDRNKRNQPTPGEFRFEGVSDAFERVQMAAAKSSILNKKEQIPEKQLDVAEKQLVVLKKLVDEGNWTKITKMAMPWFDD